MASARSRAHDSAATSSSREFAAVARIAVGGRSGSDSADRMSAPAAIKRRMQSSAAAECARGSRRTSLASCRNRDVAHPAPGSREAGRRRPHPNDAVREHSFPPTPRRSPGRPRRRPHAAMRASSRRRRPSMDQSSMRRAPSRAAPPGSSRTGWPCIDDAAPEMRTLGWREQRPGRGIADRVSVLLPQRLEPCRVGQHGRRRPGSTPARLLRAIEVAQQLARESSIRSDRRYAFGERAEYCGSHGRHGSRSSRIAGVSTTDLRSRVLACKLPQRAQRSINVEAGQWQLIFWSTAR